MTKSNCPYCNAKIPFWEKLKPAYKEPTFILCKKCNKKISDYWLKNRIGVGSVLGALAAGRIAAGSNNPFMCILGAMLCFIVIYMFKAARIQLHQCDELTKEAVQAEYMARAFSVSYVRVGLIVVSVVVAFTLFIWVLSNGKT
jgi:hypothetical protein